MRVAIFVLMTLAAMPELGRAACGDGVLDPEEACDPVIRRCCSDTCQRTDADFDGICDDVDVCRTSIEARAPKPRSS